MFKYDITAKTIKGAYRNANQDCILALSNSKNIICLAVFDGLGGLSNGEIASNVAKSYIESKLEDVSTLDEIKDDCVLWLKAINDLIYKRSKKESISMGTTAVLMFVKGDKYLVLNVGDSSLDFYNAKKDTFTSITNKHTTLQQAEDDGLPTEHISRNVLTSCLGAMPTIRIDIHFGDLVEGVYTVSSDGCWEFMEKKHLSTVWSTKDLVASDYLVEVAEDSGSRDNISVVALVARWS